MGYREALVALADELAVATAIIVIIIIIAKEAGILTLTQTILSSIVILVVFATIGYLGGKAQLGKPATGIEAMVGKRGRVVEALRPEGIIVVDGEYWRAVNINGEPIEEGEVIIRDYRGLELRVSRLDKKT